MTNQQTGPEPLPIWFFVGLILLVYGLLVVGSGLLGAPAHTVLAHTRPSLWWGAIITGAGVGFLLIGLHVHRSSRRSTPGAEDKA